MKDPVKEVLKKIKTKMGYTNDITVARDNNVCSEGSVKAETIIGDYLTLESYTEDGLEGYEGFAGWYHEYFLYGIGIFNDKAFTNDVGMSLKDIIKLTVSSYCESIGYRGKYYIYALANDELITDGTIDGNSQDIVIPLKDIYEKSGSCDFVIMTEEDEYGYIILSQYNSFEVTYVMGLTRIEITKAPNKIKYSVGEIFNPSGMEVTAYYSGGTSNPITGYKYTPTGKLTINDTEITISYEGKTTTQPIFVLDTYDINESDKKYIYFKDRQFIEASAGENLCKIDARSGLLHFSRGLLLFGGKRLPLNLSLIYDYQHRSETKIYGRETGFPKGFRTNYHQTCIRRGDVYYYTDGSANLHIYEQAINTNQVWVDRQGTGLLLKEEEGGTIKIYDEFGNYSLFDGYGRLYLIHQKFTATYSAELEIFYEGITEKITSIIDGMGRETRFTYQGNIIYVIANGSNKLSIVSSSGALSSVNRFGTDGTEKDIYTFESNSIKTITAANGEKLTINEYKDDAVIKYHSNVQDKTYTLAYSDDHQKTTVTDNKNVEQVFNFNKEDILTGTYQNLKEDGTEEQINIYCVDKETCSAFAGVISKDIIHQFKYDNQNEIKLNGSNSVTKVSDKFYYMDWLSDTKFFVFSVKMKVEGNSGNTSGKITVKLKDYGDVICTLEFNPSHEGLQIAAKPFMVRFSHVTYPSLVAEINVECNNGEFTFMELNVTPFTGNVEKLCVDIIDTGAGGYNFERNERVYFLNSNTKVRFDDGKEYDYELYSEDYLANLRNAVKSSDDFIFWFNNKRACRIGTSSAKITFGNGETITFASGQLNNIKFYSLSYATNGIATLNSPNYDSASFPSEYNKYFLQEEALISNGEKCARTYSYYDVDFNLVLEEKDNEDETVTQTKYGLDKFGNVTSVKTDAGNGLNLLNEYVYGKNDYQITAKNYIGSQTATSLYAYDFFGNVVKNTEPNNFVQNYEYDTFGNRLIQLKAAIGNLESSNKITYNNANVSQMAANAAANPKYTFSYYADGGNLKSVAINGEEYVNITYNYNVNTVYETILNTYANGYEEQNTYDEYGRIVEKASLDPSQVVLLATYHYKKNAGAAGKLEIVYDLATEINTGYTYNNYNQITSIKKAHRFNSDDCLLCEIEYNDNLLKTKESYSYQAKTISTNEYEYRTDLNYYSDVARVSITCYGVILSVQNSRDNLNRVNSIVTQNFTTQNGMQIDIGYLARSINGAGTTNYINEWKYSKKTNSTLSETRKDTFEYDINGNITKVAVKEGTASYQITYEYDSANRLIRENNQKLGKTYVNSYDSNGNITGKAEYTYATTGNLTAPQNNTYDSDRLTNWGGKSFSYDACGNPTTYKGELMEWTRVRLLKEYKNVLFEYDADGELFSKEKGNTTSRYHIINGKLVREDIEDSGIFYLYSQDGITGFAYRATSTSEVNHYYYVKNIFGDVVEIRNTTDNTLVAKYVYDAWGNHKVYDANGNENTSDTFIGNINPIRYRSYYWDSDVRLYYLHTRWYDPEIGRFINLDQLEYLDPETVNGLNLYAYCLNNPVIGVDPYGTIFFSILLAGIILGAAIGGAISGAEAYKSGARGWDLVGAIAIGVGVGGVIGGVAGAFIGAGAVMISTGASMLGGGLTGGFALAGGGALVAAGAGAMVAGGALTATGVLGGLLGLNVLFSKGFGPRMGHNQYENDQFRDAMRELGYDRTDPEWWEAHNALQNERPMKYKELLKFIKELLGL